MIPTRALVTTGVVPFRRRLASRAATELDAARSFRVASSLARLTFSFSGTVTPSGGSAFVRP